MPLARWEAPKVFHSILPAVKVWSGLPSALCKRRYAPSMENALVVAPNNAVNAGGLVRTMRRLGATTAIAHQD